MRTLLSRAALVAITLAVGLYTQVTQAQSQGGNVAVIDIFAIFKGYPRFEKLMEDIGRDAKAMEEKFRQQNDQMRKDAQPLQQYKPGSAAFKQLDEQLAKRRNDLSLELKLAQKGFHEREAAVYYSVYMEIVKEVATFSKRANITLVLRFVSTAIDPQRPSAVKQGIGKPVVFQDNIDITYEILSALKRKVPPRISNPRANLPRRR